MYNEGSKLQSYTCSVNRVNVFASATVSHTWLSALHVLHGYAVHNACNPWLLQIVGPCRDPCQSYWVATGAHWIWKKSGQWRKHWWKQVSQVHGVATKGTRSTRVCVCTHVRVCTHAHVGQKMLRAVTRDRWTTKCCTVEPMKGKGICCHCTLWHPNEVWQILGTIIPTVHELGKQSLETHAGQLMCCT